MSIYASRAAIISLVSLAWLASPTSCVFAGDLLFKRHVINDATDYSAAALIDVNHDGAIDIVCGGDWYESPTWKKHFVAEIPRISGRPDGFSHLEFDVNRDGWMDVITVNYRSRSIKWMEHPGPALGPWTVHTAAEPGPMETGRLVDIDRDGNMDLLPNGANFAAWWELRWNGPSGGDPAWIRHELPSEAGGHGLGFGDIDGDGRGDIVGQFGWLSAPEDARYGQWHWHPDFSIERGSIPMLVVDPDMDGDNDVVWCSAHGFGVYWLEQKQDENGTRKWVRHTIDTSWSQGHSPLWVDLDGDGISELVTGKRYMAHGGADPGEYDPIEAYRYQFDPATRTWQRWTLSPVGDRVGMGLDPKVADIDGDGDLDVLASGRSGLYWLENLGAGDSSSLISEVPSYNDHSKLLMVVDRAGSLIEVTDPESWGLRRYHVVSNIQRHLQAPSAFVARVALDVEIESEQEIALQDVASEQSIQGIQIRQISYSLDANQRTRAQLYLPKGTARGSCNALVCMRQNPSDTDHERAMELARRGYVCILPDWTGDVKTSPAYDDVWQVQRAIDVLQACEIVHGERLGYIGDAAFGQLGLYAAAIDQRLVAIYCDAEEATSLAILQTASNHSLAELIATSAPRALRINLPRHAQLAQLVQDQAQIAREVFELRNVPQRLTWNHSGQMEEIYVWLEESFRRPQPRFAR